MSSATRHTRPTIVLRLVVVGLTLLAAIGPAYAQQNGLTDLSLQDLLDLEVTSASRKEQKVGRTAAAVYVITRQDIARSGLTTLPDLLRLVPGLSVSQVNSSSWSVTSRGFGSLYANKLLVLVDGRSIYSQLFGGVYWEQQLLPVELIEQIEVIRGPGGSLWGSNAINGIINIITKSADQEQGVSARTSIGSYDGGSGRVHVGGRVGDTGYHSTTASVLRRRAPAETGGLEDADALESFYARTRFDWNQQETNRFTFTADVQDGTQWQVWPHVESLNGSDFRKEAINFRTGSAVFGWSRRASSRVESNLQVYYNGIHRTFHSVGDERWHIVDVDGRERIALATRHDLVVGAQYRFSAAEGFGQGAYYGLNPPSSHLHMWTGFVQDEIALGDVQVTPGLKLERNVDTGLELQPSLRALWTPAAQHTLWGAVARAVRTPTLSDRGIFWTHPPMSVEGVPLPLLVTYSGNPEFQSEIARSYEAGYRVHHRSFGFDATGFRTRYDELARIARSEPQFGFGPGGMPVLHMTTTTENGNEATAWGAELAATLRLASWWQVAGDYSYLTVDFAEIPSATHGPVPRHQVHARSYVDLPKSVRVSALLYRTSEVPDLGIGAHTRLDARASWSPRRTIELIAGARNLLQREWVEYRDLASSIQSTPLRREVYGEVAWRF